MIISQRVLVDSSGWITFFRNSKETLLSELLREDLVCTNELILTELVPFLIHADKKGAAESLSALPCISLAIDWEIIRKYQQLNLMNGINKVGIPDLIILQQVIENRLTLFTYDKHFRLMQDHLHFEILND